MSELLGDNPLFTPSSKLGNQTTKDKGKQIMEGLLLTQYQNSPNLKEYFMAYISEMDFLFEQIEEVYLGRLIENAVGEQLDVIGIILQQSRAIILPGLWFGFQGALESEGMADEAIPDEGGLFRDENVEGVVTPLDDQTYKKVLLAKAVVSNRNSADLGLAYYVISILLGRIPSVFELRDETTVGAGIGKRQIDLLIPTSAVSGAELVLITYMARYFVPSGIVFTITQV